MDRLCLFGLWSQNPVFRAPDLPGKADEPCNSDRETNLEVIGQRW